MWNITKGGYVVEKTLGRNRAVGLWYTDDITQAGTKTAVDISETVDSLPINLGQPYPDPNLPGAICVSKRLIQSPSSGKAFVQVTYDSANRFGGAQYGGTTSRARLEPWRVPKATAYPGSPVRYDIKWVELGTRGVIEIYDVKYMSSNDEVSVIQAVALNTGKGYVVKGIPVILAGADTLTRPGSLMRVVYRYEIKAATKFIPTGNGFDLFLPALGIGEEHVVVYLLSGAPSVGVATLPDLYDPGTPLP